jgi:hypothetical protein
MEEGGKIEGSEKRRGGIAVSLVSCWIQEGGGVGGREESR